MSLLFVILVGLAAFCFYMGGPYIWVGIICLAGLSRKIGWVAQLIAAGYLFSMGHRIAGFIPIILLGLVILGWFQRKEDKIWRVTGKYEMRDLIPCLIKYTRAYLKAQMGLSAAKAEDLILDQGMGKEIDGVVDLWCSETPVVPEDDQETAVEDIEPVNVRERTIRAIEELMALGFEAPEMQSLNSVLDKYAAMFPPEPDRAAKIVGTPPERTNNS